MPGDEPGSVQEVLCQMSGRHREPRIVQHASLFDQFGKLMDFLRSDLNEEVVTSTHAGSRPGESWADVIFSFVLSKILLQIMEQATAENLLTELTLAANGGIYGTAARGQTLPAKDCTWADDSAFPLSDADPQRLLAKTSRMGSLILDYCQRHGMAPNLRPKKTAIILAVRGKGSQRAKKQWFPQGAKSLHLRDLDLKIQVTGQYVHLGGLVDTELQGAPLYKHDDPPAGASLALCHFSDIDLLQSGFVG
ncbi:hypothetical protein AK812_SmicGene34169 [Symbiodinium microadriaticum]|uniref:Uncharacterized protein n=1 Tax=Symbiodinium microadriaticum TaxID=2951 RepID=A0A1Q9CPQ4_SYMMI|nr:hypothetical protein AK812_SmicGene34169 [Symbiodinium microadriaticum]